MSKFYSVEEVSSLIGVEADTIREWISAGKLTASRRAGEVVLRNNDVKRLMDEYGVAESDGEVAERSVSELTEQDLTFAPPSVAAKAGARNLAAAVSAATAVVDKNRAVDEEFNQDVEQSLVLNNDS
ncbi:helix-turn-helix domain-containing protein [bacterium]|nr:helix-turn-helix domain-containing protein [bacterium]